MATPARLFYLMALMIVLPLAGCTLDVTPLTELDLQAIATPQSGAAEADEDAPEVTIALAVNLYSGPGRFFETLGTTVPGQVLQVRGVDESGDWYLLMDGRWVTAFAVQQRVDVPVVGAFGGRVAAQVTDVLDGDAIEVQFDNRTFQVRYLISSAPQIEQAFGEEAYEFNRELVEDKRVLLEVDVERVDVYGRLLAYVFVGDDDLMVNEELLRQGLAQVVVFPPEVEYEERLRLAQREAQALGRGMWADQVIPYRETDEGVCLHTVQPGEQMLVIAKRFGILMDALVAANQIENPDLVPAGTELVIPGCGPASAETPPTASRTPQPSE